MEHRLLLRWSAEVVISESIVLGDVRLELFMEVGQVVACHHVQFADQSAVGVSQVANSVLALCECQGRSLGVLVSLVHVLLELDVVAQELVHLHGVVLVVQANRRQHRHVQLQVLLQVLVVAALLFPPKLFELVLELLLAVHRLHQKLQVLVDVVVGDGLVEVVLAQVLPHFLSLASVHLLDSILDVRQQASFVLLSSVGDALRFAAYRVSILAHQHRQAELCLRVFDPDLLLAVLDGIAFARPLEVRLKVLV